jgi:hypothetical protein
MIIAVQDTDNKMRLRITIFDKLISRSLLITVFACLMMPITSVHAVTAEDGFNRPNMFASGFIEELADGGLLTNGGIRINANNTVESKTIKLAIG